MLDSVKIAVVYVCVCVNATLCFKNKRKVFFFKKEIECFLSHTKNPRICVFRNMFFPEILRIWFFLLALL
jgi:hypothetical protein